MIRSRRIPTAAGYLLLSLAFLLLIFVFDGSAQAADGLILVIDGQVITSDPPPVLLNGRTMVPARLVTETLGARVDWFDADSSVHIVKPDRAVVMRIDNHFVKLDTGSVKYMLTDVAPTLIGGRTYVPLRLVSNAMGVQIDWDQATLTVSVDSSQSAEVDPSTLLRITTVTAGSVLSSATNLRAEMAQGNFPAGASEIRWLLIRPETGKGVVINRGTNVAGTYSFTPDTMTNGERFLVAAVYNAQGRLLAGDAIPVTVNLVPQVSFSGVTAGQQVQGAVTLRPVLNFPAAYVTYEILAQASGRRVTSAKADPLGTYSFTPMLEDIGPVSVTMTAYNMAGNAFPSATVSYTVNTERQVELRGVSGGATISRPVAVSVYGNFRIAAIEYVMRDVGSGVTEQLGWTETAGVRFVPTPARQGTKDIFARVTDHKGEVFQTAAVRVNVSGASFLLMSGVGPKQVVTGPVTLTAESNIPLERVRYMLTNATTGVSSEIGNVMPGDQFTWTPNQAGEWSLRAQGIAGGNTVQSSDAVSFRVYLGTVYGPRPVVPREQFAALASGLALKSWQGTGMSAALQVAQAILETGWGQSIPVDKYTGLFSNNLFGIKGTGPAGTVISNTWEEYNGVAFRIDANFRAYYSVEQSWADHKNLLLVAARYQPFRDVMYDMSLGAWALRRAGYATDSQYPMKLMDIIMRFELWKLDEVGV
ncbi:MAG TPA: stalk domain-containing protein [Bacillota bacterium]|nr:stalk domain-containing protein [Bacillota bacterium]